MAIPTTQKECTTRRIASLIIGLWGKVKNAFLLKTSRGAANGVASLGSDGKVPMNQLPTNCQIFGSAEMSVSPNKYAKLLKINSSSLPSYNDIFVIVNFITTTAAGMISAGEINIRIRHNAGDNFNYKARFFKKASTSINPIVFYDSSSNDLYLYGKQTDNNYSGVIAFVEVQTLQNGNITDFITTFNGESLVESVPYTELTMELCILPVCSTLPKGSSSVPVYVDSNGIFQACSNIPVIEHVTSIPVNPTVGTIYAL